ncbi:MULTISPECIES: hypothetical protein [Oceanobacillus]|uniref:Uncharacterized protein n=1 Tax=Oceanobacillus neutriphilus TaxID=531815 RepID=A0ABQ2NZT1_9BACI|nr:MULTISPECIES: hypothetical protein [Oceanobacillus]MCT1904742.1 hypothetical protein [Oceanobacillus sojae]GGP14658.1 hypothetical protein GCM10011346_39490 [Oceanobacillus neutriphilus]
MKYVMEALRRKEAEERLPVIKLEIDYELATLYEAMQDEDTVQIIKSKERLKQLSEQWMALMD